MSLALERQSSAPVVFEEFFELGQEETASPFITKPSRRWGANLSLKSALLAAFFLIAAFILSFDKSLLPLSYLLTLFVYFLAGTPSLIESLEDLANWDVNIDILMTYAAFSSILIGSSMEGALLLVLFALSHSMEDQVTSKAKGAISNLKKLSPTKATLITPEGKTVERAIQDINIHEHIIVKAGEIVPLDGVVIHGATSLNLVHLTGENLPVPKKVGDTVPAGGRNMEGSITLKVTQTANDSTIARIIRLVVEAHEAKPKLQRWFDKLSRAYALTIILLSFLFSLSLPFLLNIPFLGIEGSIYRALAFLIAASPCALIIAIPIAYLSAVSACANAGILIKGGITLDAFAACRTIALDKTGTLTTGELSLIQIKSFDENNKTTLDEALSIAYSLEKGAIHPIAKAIVNEARKKNISSHLLENFNAIPGEGLEADWTEGLNSFQVAIGHAGFIASKLSSERAKALLEAANLIQNQGELVAILLCRDELFFFRLTDTLRPNISAIIKTLQEDLKLKTVMLTGDHDANARSIANASGIKIYFANLKPEDKLNYVSQMAKEGGLAMVGDGINDAPALARATVGICMGQVGHTAAMEAADIVLLQDNIDRIGWLYKKAKKTSRIVLQNLILAAGAILLASIPALLGWVPLWLAVVLHEGGTVLVGLNGLRLLRN